MKYDFLLDTSSFRALSREIICRLEAEDNNIFVSPYSFWELLCHLDKKGKFECYKAHLMKFDYARILDDPRAEFEGAILINDTELIEQISDKELINGLLNALENSSTLFEFYSSYIKDSKGQIHLIFDCSKRVKEVLNKEEKRYIKFLKNIIGAIQSGEVNVETIYDHNDRILELVNGKKSDLLSHGACNEKLADEVLKGTYIYYAYIFYRALNNFIIPDLAVDKNDYEDAQICFHLKLNTNYYLITADKGMKKALEQTIFLIDHIKSRKIKTTLRVDDISFIKSLIKG